MIPDDAQSKDHVGTGGTETSVVESEHHSRFRPDGSPDWEAITFDVLCSRCGYNLRTLTRPKCTECGLEFEWREVIRRAAHQSDFLFEHHWRKRPLRSLCRTLWLSFRPRTFWERVSIHERIQLGPLVLLCIVATFSFSAIFHGLAAAAAIAMKWFIGSPSPFIWSSTSLPFVDRAWELSLLLADIGTVPESLGFRYLWVILLIVTPLAAAFGILCTLWQTLGRCRVRAAQVFRVVAYSATPVCFWCSALLLVIISTSELAPPDNFLHFGDGAIPLVACVGCLIGVFGAYLSTGLRRYLLLPRPRALGFTAAFVGLLATFTLMAALAALQIGIFK